MDLNRRQFLQGLGGAIAATLLRQRDASEMEHAPSDDLIHAGDSSGELAAHGINGLIYVSGELVDDAIQVGEIGTAFELSRMPNPDLWAEGTAYADYEIRKQGLDMPDLLAWELTIDWLEPRPKLPTWRLEILTDTSFSRIGAEYPVSVEDDGVRYCGQAILTEQEPDYEGGPIRAVFTGTGDLWVEVNDA